MANFFRVFVKAFAQISAPLVALTKDGMNVQADWSEEHDAALEKLKQAIATATAVTAYDPTKEAVLQIDSCRMGVGAMLAQVYGKHLRPVAFFSKRYTEPAWEWKGPGTDEHITNAHKEKTGVSKERPRSTRPGSSKPPQLLELRGIVETALHWRQYLIGNAVGIRILSDHGSLRYVESQRSKGLCSDQTERWCQFLSALNAKVQWRAGAAMSVSDYLSRYADPTVNPSQYADTAEGMKPVEKLLSDISLDADDFGGIVRQ